MKPIKHDCVTASLTRNALLLGACLGSLVLGTQIIAKQIPDENLNPKPPISPTTIPAGSSYFEFDLESARPGKAVEQPELILPVKNPYAVRIETTANVDIPAAIKELESITSGVITGMVYDVTGHKDEPGKPWNVTKWLALQGITLDYHQPLSKANVYLAQYTPVISGTPSDITQYRLLTVIDVADIQALMTQAWDKTMARNRLTEYLMIVGILVTLLLTSRGNQAMTARDTRRSSRILFNSAVILSSCAALAIAAMSLA